MIVFIAGARCIRIMLNDRVDINSKMEENRID
jgi:hypothetical protein